MLKALVTKRFKEDETDVPLTGFTNVKGDIESGGRKHKGDMDVSSGSFLAHEIVASPVKKERKKK